jgi:hypothetical protein
MYIIGVIILAFAMTMFLQRNTYKNKEYKNDYHKYFDLFKLPISSTLLIYLTYIISKELCKTNELKTKYITNSKVEAIKSVTGDAPDIDPLLLMKVHNSLPNF